MQLDVMAHDPGNDGAFFFQIIDEFVLILCFVSCQRP